MRTRSREIISSSTQGILLGPRGRGGGTGEMKTFVSILCVLSASIAAYFNSLDGGFAFDDHRAILTNGDLDSGKTTIGDLFSHDFWGGPMSRVESHKSYRPLTVLTFRYLNFHFGGLRPYGYHVANVLLHGAASVLCLLVAELLLGKGSWWACFCALFFSVHSIHTEAVANITGRAEALSCIFFQLAFLAYARAVSTGSGSSLALRSARPMHVHQMHPSSTDRQSQTNYHYYYYQWHYIVLCLAMSACSLLSKEQGVTVLGVCAGFDVLLHYSMWSSLIRRTGAKDDRRKSLPLSNDGANTNNGGSSTAVVSESGCRHGDSAGQLQVSGLITRLGVLGVCGGLLMWFRLSMNYDSQPIFKEEELVAAYHPNRTVRILSFSNIYSINLWLLLAPSALCCDWSLGSVPLVSSLADMRNVWSLIMYTSLGVLGMHVLRAKRAVLIGTSLAFLIVPFIPATGILVRVGFVIAERVLYTPTFGWCLLVTFGFKRIAHQSKLCSRAVYLMMVLLLLVMAAKTVTRNQDWRSDFALFESGVKVIPSNVKLRNNYGMELKSAGRIEEAREQYLKIIELDPEYGEVYMNYGNLLADERNYSGAADSFEKAIQYPQQYAKTLNNLATMYFKLGRLKEAEERFKESLQLTPDQATTYNNLASLYGESKRYGESEEMFRKALELNPDYTEAYFNLGTLLYQIGRVGEAEQLLLHALRLNPQHYGAANNLKVIQFHKNREIRQN